MEGGTGGGLVGISEYANASKMFRGVGFGFWISGSGFRVFGIGIHVLNFGPRGADRREKSLPKPQ